MSLYKFAAQGGNRSNGNTPKLKPGKYNSEVVACEPTPGYKEDQSVDVSYRLTDSNGVQYPYTETFWTPDDYLPRRTKEFDEYCIEAGFDGDIVGLKETVTLGYEVIKGKRHLNVTHRSTTCNDSDEVIELDVARR